MINRVSSSYRLINTITISIIGNDVNNINNDNINTYGFFLFSRFFIIEAATMTH